MHGPKCLSGSIIACRHQQHALTEGLLVAIGSGQPAAAARPSECAGGGAHHLRSERLVFSAAASLLDFGAAGNTEHFFARNGISTEHARSTSGARLYSVLVRISESDKSF